jgi:hypothetical protein
MRNFITKITGTINDVLGTAKCRGIVGVLVTRALVTTRFLLARLTGRQTPCYAAVPICRDRREALRSGRMLSHQSLSMPRLDQGWRLSKQATGAPGARV